MARKARKRTRKARDIYAEITAKMVELLEAGVAPWRKGWTLANAPRNFRTKRAYRGVNVWILRGLALAAGYGSPFWLTFKQAKAAGGTVRKGEKGTMVVFWKPGRRKVENEATGELETKRTLLTRYYTVFNLDQCDGIEAPELDASTFDGTPTEAAEAIVAGYLADGGPTVAWDGTSPRFTIGADTVHMPKRAEFKSEGELYSTLFHELTHSTGHHTRLDRLEAATFGDHAYSKEELVAEMGASFLLADAGIECEATTANSAAYLANWIAALKGDKSLLIGAGQRAQKAADLVLASTRAAELLDDEAEAA